MFEWFREADTPAGPAFSDAIRTDSTKCQFVPVVSVEFFCNTQSWQCWHFRIALITARNEVGARLCFYTCL